MKKSVLCALTVLLLSSCIGYKELPVEYEFSYRGISNVTEPFR